MIYVIYTLFVVICWSVNPFLKKIVNKTLLPLEYSIYNNTIILFVFIVCALYSNIYMTINKQPISFNITDRLTYKEIGILVCSSVFTLVPSYLMTILSKQYSVSGIMTTVQSLSIILTSLIGVVLFNETLTNSKIGGIICSSVGIYLINN